MFLGDACRFTDLGRRSSDSFWHHHDFELVHWYLHASRGIVLVRRLRDCKNNDHGCDPAHYAVFSGYGCRIIHHYLYPVAVYGRAGGAKVILITINKL